MDNGESAAKNKISLNEIPEDSFFSETVYLDDGFVLATPEMQFDYGIIKALKDWSFNEVFSKGEILEDYAAGKAVNNEGAEFAEPHVTSGGDKLQMAEDFYSSLEQFMEFAFSRFIKRGKLDYNAIVERVKTTCEFVKEEKRFLLRVLKNDFRSPDHNYLASHSVKTTILSIIIGSYLKLPNHRLIELAISAMFHEIGMAKLPPQLYLSNRTLEPHERKAILAHPILGFNILKTLEAPLAISLGALEHHERENGAGYPQRLTGNKISLYSKIIAVACSYEALSSHRPHKEAKDGYTGMLELLRNEGKQYDDTVVRALVFSLSIYPIGLYVLLSSGRKGQVIDVNPESPRYPIVQVFGELTPDGKNKILQTSPDDITIVRPLTKEEIGSASGGG